MNHHPRIMTLDPCVFNICIMVCNGFVVHGLTKCIYLQNSNHHTGRDQSLLIFIVCAWNEKMLFLLFLSHSKMNIPPVVFLWVWMIFFSWKSKLGSHPKLEASGNFNNNKRKRWKAVRKPKRQKSPTNLNVKGHAKITRKSDSQNKVSMPRPKQWKKANQIKVAKEKMKDTKSWTADSDP